MQPIPGVSGRHEGIWVGAGAINDAGTAAATFTTQQQGDRGRLEANHVLTSAKGTITLELKAWLSPFPPQPARQVMVEGSWKLVAATGDYAGLKAAQGKLYGTADRTVVPPQVTHVLEGTAH